METFKIENDVQTICVTADRFPEGVKAAFEKLHHLTSGFDGRTMFGISYWENDRMIYKAACSQLVPGEAGKLNGESYTIRSGNYLSETIEDWQNHMDQFPLIFQKLGDSDPKTEMPGIEWYEGNDVRCMLRLAKEVN